MSSLWRGVRVVCFVFRRRESAGGDREWPVAAGSKWSGEGLLPHQQKEVSADGCAGGAQCSHHYIRYSVSRLLYIIYTKQTDTAECNSRNTNNS